MRKHKRARGAQKPLMNVDTTEGGGGSGRSKS
jgi:hypothetical protein